MKNVTRNEKEDDCNSISSEHGTVLSSASTEVCLDLESFAKYLEERIKIEDLDVVKRQLAALVAYNSNLRAKQSIVKEGPTDGIMFSS